MSSRATRAPSANTKSQIKAAAQMLFARQAIDGVTVQQIISAAGQRNNAALHYHFGSKEELIRQLVIDGAQVLEGRRQTMLQEIDARGGPTSIREIVLVLVMPVVELSNDERWNGYIRFTSNLQASDPDKLRSALNNRWNASYVRCFADLKQMLPLPAEIAEQRLSIFAIYANAILSAREAAMEMQKSKHSRLWNKKFTTQNILDTLEATLTFAPSTQTIKAMEDKANSIG